ncbi:MAG: hypothetical protein R3B46_08985 [Phycisphaerales bacterium]
MTASIFQTCAGFDHGGYHLPVIRAFEAQLPTPDLHDYASATTFRLSPDDGGGGAGGIG